ncbi:hypothetical protein [Parasaccharibacter sp. TMW 2.1888]|uniref:hypothetical protein n=1 Tax=Parasaccharibacter sp. TMW 2.1888 TaxID=2268025 RepID=UPI0020C0765D|nr:hypothetical protein [Parasaccharibacter sp. TMW 2.1888]
MNRIELVDLFSEPYDEKGMGISSYDEAISFFHNNINWGGSIFRELLNNNIPYKEIFDKNTHNKSYHLEEYKNAYTCYCKSHMESNFSELDAAIEKCGSFLSEGQILFHAGTLKNANGSPLNTGSTMRLYRPLSTSFSPEPAYNNALHKSKAYDNVEICLIKITIKSQNIKAYVYGDGEFNHEFEVIIKSGPNIIINNIKTINHIKVEKMLDPTVRPLENWVPYKFIEASIEQ